MQRIAKFIFFVWIIFYAGLSQANTFNFKPVGNLPTAVQTGQTVSAVYNVTSVGTFPPAQYHIILATLSNPANVTQNLTVARACGIFPINPTGCILQLDIVGPVSGPVKICDDWKGRPGLNCYIPSNPNDFLNVRADASPHLTISPPITFLGPNIPQTFTVVNTSTTAAAINVTMTIPSNVQAQLAGAPVYNGCGSIAPLGSCTITITATGSPSAQSGIATIQGTNTAAPAPIVTITTGAAPALVVSPPTTILGPNNSQQFIVTNTSTTTSATDVTITIPANVEAQLSGTPVYSGCTLIAPLATCTMTITAVASPNAQSGIASIQGTNTAAPAPTVAITTGAAPALTVSPLTTILGPNASQQFIVTNTSTSISALNVIMFIAPNVQAQLLGAPVYSGCVSIAPLGTCTITITAVASPNAQSGLATVQGTNTAALAPTVAITTGATPALTVSPPTTILGPNTSQQFIVTNTSAGITAQNVTMTIPANVQGQLTSLPVYSGCGSIAPLGICTITITAVASPNAQSATATVQGTNTAAPAPTVAITTGAAPALTVSPPTTILGPNGSQQFIVTNTSATIAAQNVTMTIPANVQGQLISLPVYSGCSSIAALGTCTVTITAVASPNAQSGIATVQGTNTAAPAPTVTITTGAAPALLVSPSTTILGPNNSQQFIVTNTSTTIAAQNITMTIPANVQGQLTNLPVYSSCGLIAPLGTCTITITAATSPSAQSGIATVQGTNTAAPAPTVTITTGAAPTLTVSPLATVLGPNGIQVFIVTNTSSSIAAQNVTMTIPANIQGQLTSLPAYSGCTSIAALGTCTITITAVASPNAQSGIATVQGTNTAAPPPTVAITTGAAPALTVSPPTTILGPNGSQQFIVTNTSATIAAQNVTMTIPANVQGQLTSLPVYSGCGSIAALGACTVTITAVASPSAQSGTATVQGTNTAAPAPIVTITTGAAPALTVSPSTTTLGPNASQQFIVTNTSTNIAALNVTMTIPANVQGQLSSLPVYNGCGSIAPLGTCTITITAVALPNAQSGIASVQGTNTAAPAPTAAITIGAAPTLTVSPSTTVLGPSGAQVFTVTNTSNSIAAQNVTMTIPANVQGQLTGLPIYSGCGLIAPLSTCTITITAVASPNAQSGIASVQGTNTAAPAPTVTISTGSAPVLTISPNSANIASNGSQIFTVTNTGTITANNITMTISGNVQGQLVGLPIYSSDCASLLPASSACTITIQAVSSPSSQSGIGTVQGTNTAAPSPVVSIFILPVCTVLGATTVTNTGLSMVTGAVCVAPGAAITGFPPGQTTPVAGQLHSNDSIASSNHTDANTLFNVIAGLTCTDIITTDLAGLILPPGVYCFNTAAATLAAGGILTLNGSVTDKWYFKIGTTLTTGANSSVILTGGAVAGNIFWQIGSSGTFGANTAFSGQVIAFTSLTIGAGLSNNGRLWVVNAAITLDTDSIGP